MPRTLGIDPALAREARQWVSRIVQMSMLYREMNYRELADRLNELRVEENERNLRNKVAKGEFSAAFFLLCLKAMDMDHLRVADWAWLTNGREHKSHEPAQIAEDGF
jgi:hypothetical protein